MTIPIKGFHTHSNGETYGWFGSVTHPAHRKTRMLKQFENPYVDGTAWSFEIHADSFEEIIAAAKAVVEKHWHGAIHEPSNV